MSSSLSALTWTLENSFVVFGFCKNAFDVLVLLRDVVLGCVAYRFVGHLISVSSVDDYSSVVRVFGKENIHEYWFTPQTLRTKGKKTRIINHKSRKNKAKPRQTSVLRTNQSISSVDKKAIRAEYCRSRAIDHFRALATAGSFMTGAADGCSAEGAGLLFCAAEGAGKDA